MDLRLLIVGVLAIIIVSGCTTGKITQPPEQSQQLSNTSPQVQETPANIKIASWNVENWGQAKSSNPQVMRAIANTLKNYDIIAIQEISNVREQSDPGCPRNEGACPGDASCGIIRNALERYLNQENGLNYEFVFSPQVKDERYLYVYDPAKVMLEEAELVEDSGDSLPICDANPSSTGRMVRQPFRARFSAGNSTFVLLTAHTSPTINLQELEGLEYFYRQTEALGWSDIIVLGDLNADCGYLKPSDSISFRRPEYMWVVDDSTDTTVASTDCAYDRFVFKVNDAGNYYTGNWGVYTNITPNVSDHYLIWAEFSID